MPKLSFDEAMAKATAKGFEIFDNTQLRGWAPDSSGTIYESVLDLDDCFFISSDKQRNQLVPETGPRTMDWLSDHVEPGNCKIWTQQDQSRGFVDSEDERPKRFLGSSVYYDGNFLGLGKTSDVYFVDLEKYIKRRNGVIVFEYPYASCRPLTA